MATSIAAARDAALDFLWGRIDYERFIVTPYSERRLKLARMRELLARLGDPQNDVPIVHVAGSKGKGSTSAMIAGMLTAAGHRAGLYCSPHLHRVEERFVVDGLPCDGDELAGLVDAVRPAVAEMDAVVEGEAFETGPTFFEITTAIALLHFKRRGCTAAVLEVGLGGRLDSTNVCQPQVAVITSISFDHMKQLGDTLPEIAREKAGIIKPGVATVSGVRNVAARQVIEEVAAERGSALFEIGRDFDFEFHAPSPQWAGAVNREALRGRIDFRTPSFALSGVEIGLLGRHQGANAAVALATVEALRRSNWNIADDACRRGLADVRWPARVEFAADAPTVVIDAAHNVASIAALQATLDDCLRAPRKLLIFATTLEKDVSGMLAEVLPRYDHVYFTRYANNPRGVPVEELTAIANAIGAAHHSEHASLADAWQTARGAANPATLITVTGSFFIAAEMRELLGLA
jgi:dihydrofolate synthase/folylpolyglutamate synthase